MIGYIYTSDKGWHRVARAAEPGEYDGPLLPGRTLYITECGLLSAYNVEHEMHSYPEKCDVCNHE